MRRMNFFNFANRSGRTRPWSYQPLTEMSNRSRDLMFLGSRARPVRKADNLTAICEPIVYNISQPYRPPLPVTEIAFTLLLTCCSLYVGDGAVMGVCLGWLGVLLSRSYRCGMGFFPVLELLKRLNSVFTNSRRFSYHVIRKLTAVHVPIS
jgi:hypothetical protein